MASLPDGAVAEIRRRIIDSVGCSLVGMESPTVQVLRRLAQDRQVDGGCLVWGTDVETTPEIAALINGTAVRYLDFNDRMLGGHPSDVIPAVFAACEASGGGTAELIAGIAVNYEIYGELGRLIIRDKGWDQGTTSVAAAACAVGRALGLTVEQFGHAVGIAVTANAATRQTRRGHLSMWKGVAQPYAAQCGMIAAFMAQAGMTGPDQPFEGPNGFFEQIIGPFEIQELKDPAKPTYLFKSDLKYWPTEYNTQATVWLGLEIRKRIAADQIAAIDLETNEWGWYVTGREPEKWIPETRETADHSMPYALSRGIMNGELVLGDFEPEAFTDPATRALMARISIRPADDITAAYPEKIMARATVTTKDGAQRRFEVGDPRGRHTNPMTDGDVAAKFHKLAAASRLADRGQQIYDALATISGDGRLDKIRALLRDSSE